MANKRQRKKNNRKSVSSSPSTKLVNEFRRLRTNTLSKLNRIEKNVHPNARLNAETELKVDLTVKPLEYTDKNVMKKAMEEMKKFTNRHNTKFQYVKNDYGVWSTKKEINELTRIANRNIRKAQREQKEAIKNNQNFYVGGKQHGSLEARKMLLGEVNLTGITIPSPFNFKEVRNQPRLDEIKRGITLRANPKYYDERTKRMQDNFVGLMEQSFNDEAKVLADRLRNLSPDEFYAIWLQIQEFDFNLYDSEGWEDEGGKVEQMMLYLDKIERGEITVIKGI